MKSFIGNQLAALLVVFQMPPQTLPAHMVEVVVGWTRIERTRPPMLPGPSQIQELVSMPAVFRPGTADTFAPGHAFGSTGISCFCWSALRRPSGGIFPFSSRICIARNSAAARWYLARGISAGPACAASESNAIPARIKPLVGSWLVISAEVVPYHRLFGQFCKRFLAQDFPRQRG